METTMKILLVLILIFTFEARAESPVIDGDSLRINNKDIRLIGIDAPEYDQYCFDANNIEYECGQEAYMFLKILVENGLKQNQKLKCNKKGMDKYKRDLSECFIGNININKAMIKSGYAVVYRHDSYQKLEDQARKRQIGIWQGKFMRPELYRILNKYKNNKKNISK